jgi:hypothetical protein
MFKVDVDKEANLLSFHYAGQVGVAELQEREREIQLALADLQPGFRLLTDLTNLESMDLKCVPQINKVMDLCNKQGVSLIVRVIPNPQKDIGLTIMSLFHYHRRVHIVTCKSISEANQALTEVRHQ